MRVLANPPTDWCNHARHGKEIERLIGERDGKNNISIK